MSKKWTEAEIKEMENMLSKGYTLKQISSILNRSYGGVKGMSSKLRLNEKYNTKRYKDLTGMKFGNLIVLEKAENKIKPSGQTVTMWKCQCQCEKKTIMFKSYESLTKSKRYQSCGCVEVKKNNDNSDKVGLENISNEGCLMRIIDYNSYEDVTVEFVGYNYKTKTRWSHFVNGDIHNPYMPTFYNVGFVGTKYNTKKYKKEYRLWMNMMRRCYGEIDKSYENVDCCYEWRNFENFVEWIINEPNYDKWLKGGYELDKDILSKYNKKEYSPNTCCLIKKYVNSIFIFTRKDRDYLLGISKNKNIFNVNVFNPVNKSKSKNVCKNIEEATDVLFKEKNKMINYVADHEFKEKNISKRCYEGMINYIKNNQCYMMDKFDKLTHELEDRGVELV